MGKYKFATKKKKKKDPHLGRIILIVGVAAFALYGGARYAFESGWTRNAGGEAAEASRVSPIEQAGEHIEAGRLDKARALLSGIIEGRGDHALAPQALLMKAEIEEKAGNLDQAIALLDRAVSEFPGSQHRPQAATRYARLLEQQGNSEAALAVYEDLKASAPPAHRAAAVLGLGRQAERENDLAAARDFYAKALEDADWDSEIWNEALDALGAVNVKMIFSPAETPESKVYRVQSGDNLTHIGMTLNTTLGLLMRANNIEDPGRLHLNQSLKYTPKDFRIIIERSTCRLFLVDSNGIFKRYYTGLGMPGHETTLGRYKIGNKQKDPTWFKPGSEPIPPGDPENELGTRWMPLVPVEESLPTDLGIHGTIAPETIGSFASRGCARMHNAEAEELYDLVVRSTPVEIVEVWRPEGGSADYVHTANVPGHAG